LTRAIAVRPVAMQNSFLNELEPIKVLIVNEDGHYLSGTALQWEFTNERCRARVFDYSDDRVAQQIELVKKVHGMVWIAGKLDPREAFEFCDRCGGRMVAPRAYFDGLQFLCGECRASLAPPGETLGLIPAKP
jgi:hypothetical protein